LKATEPLIGDQRSRAWYCYFIRTCEKKRVLSLIRSL